ncbi:tRNA dihydrouridine synthase [Thalassoglobus polymorphus]|uniref:tRNA-dihydrouridine synthase n=1 Tax=Thalassoglobus polymorphus TaxID=2527994 RepID=A0A517QQ60_9PLAN|nr:tRNA-dihydrouridine synthase [Thalassoglobus polymorphus]QDT33713.1 tRNA-dihydrouridine synthase C [Thalassoglobus polymorphus]
MTSAQLNLDESPIKIGTRLIPTRYFLAPLAGYTHLAFRRVIRELGGLGLATTDLVLASQLVAESQKSKKLIETTPDDTPLSIQIFSGVKAELVRAAKWLEDRGYASIDINMGCPMAKINGSGGGARLMCDTDGACASIGEVVNAVTVPVTVKMRLGWDRENLTAPVLAREFEKLGVAAITIHGRTRQQGFHGEVDREGIKAVVEAVENIPVVGNGDVRTLEDAHQMRAETGCQAVAIGRGAMLDPWIFAKLAQVATGETPTEPNADEQVNFLRRHFHYMTQQYDDYSCLLFRKFAGWYGLKLGIPDDLEDRLRRFESISEFDEIADQIRARHGEREATLPTALIKVPNGPVERW